MKNNHHESGAKDSTFLNLSPTELEAMRAVSFFRIKREITEKIISSFSQLEAGIFTVIQDFSESIPDKAMQSRGKISRGENYLGLPYLVLDYPAAFTKSGIYAFRTMFWWGHGFSFTFHVSGEFLSKMPDEFFEKVLLLPDHYMLCIGPDQWEHHFEPNNYCRLSDLNISATEIKNSAMTKGFLKITCRLETEKYHLLQSHTTDFIKNILS